MQPTPAASPVTSPVPMEYRRFGKTELKLSVVTLGGMRYPHGWSNPEETPALPEDSLEACYQCSQRALDMGINLIETAHGYGISERLYGATLPRLRQRREDFYLMTKGALKDYDDAMRTVELQLKWLGVDHIDLYAWHGVNNRECLTQALGSATRALHELRDQGVIGHVGFFGPRAARCADGGDRLGPVRVREPALLLFLPAQLAGGGDGGRARYGRLYHLAQRQGGGSFLIPPRSFAGSARRSRRFSSMRGFACRIPRFTR